MPSEEKQKLITLIQKEGRVPNWIRYKHFPGWNETMIREFLDEMGLCPYMQIQWRSIFFILKIDNCLIMKIGDDGKLRFFERGVEDNESTNDAADRLSVELFGDVLPIEDLGSMEVKFTTADGRKESYFISEYKVTEPQQIKLDTKKMRGVYFLSDFKDLRRVIGYQRKIAEEELLKF